MFVCALLGLGIVLLAVPLALAATPLRNRLQRGQDLHHTHNRPTPRLGGLALVIAFIGVEVFIAVCCPEQRSRMAGHMVVVLSSLAMFGLGFWDDLKPLGAKRKLVAQIVIALSVYVFGVGIEHFRIPFVSIDLDLGNWGALVTVLWLVGMTNLINLIDGMDGLAGGICLMLMCLLAYVAHDNGGFALLMSGMAGALIGFLCFNFPPARIYLGDSGAYFLGFPDRVVRHPELEQGHGVRGAGGAFVRAGVTDSRHHAGHPAARVARAADISARPQASSPPYARDGVVAAKSAAGLLCSHVGLSGDGLRGVLAARRADPGAAGDGGAHSAAVRGRPEFQPELVSGGAGRGSFIGNAVGS